MRQVKNVFDPKASIKFDCIPFDPCNSIEKFDLCPFDLKIRPENSTYLQPPGDDWIQCDFYEGCYHENCSGLREVIISQLSQAKYLLSRCSLCLDNRKVEEKTRKVIKDTIQETLPSIMKTALEQLNMGELSRTTTEPKSEVKSLKQDRVKDKPLDKTFSEAVNSNDPGPKTRSAYVQTQRFDTVFNDNQLVSSSKPVRKKREVKIGTGETDTFKGSCYKSDEVGDERGRK